MPPLKITVSRIEEKKPHPNANKMELIRTKGWWCCTGINNFKVGDKVIHFPPETLIPEKYALEWNINKTCEEVIVNNKKYYKISIPKLRGIRSFGFCIKPEIQWDVDTDVTLHYQVLKFESPILDKKYKIKALPNLLKYNDIHQINEKNTMFKPNDDVVITEKIHGVNCVIGYIKDFHNENNMIYVASSHRMRVPIIDEYNITLFNLLNFKIQFEFNNTLKSKIGQFLSTYNILHKNNFLFKVKRFPFNNTYSFPFRLINIGKAIYQLSIKQYDGTLLESYYKDNFQNDVLFYGEIYGNGIQDMSYGEPNINFKLFDIRINGQVLDYEQFCTVCNKYYLNNYKVHELFKGKFKDADLEKLVSGYTTMCDPDKIKENFKGKEGLVIKPIKEELFGSDRKIVKYINPEYITRKNKNRTEYH